MASKPLLNNIPLHCNICPKKPDFSDISHLLTHIASKGHLSHYYKTKVRSSNEEASRILIDEYDAWYAACNIEDLMSDRLDQKDRRKSRTRNSTNSATPQPSRAPTTAGPSRLNRFTDNPLDPRLSERMLKGEPHSRSASRGASPYVDPTTLQRPYGPPPMQLWNPNPYMTAMPIKQEHTSETSSESSIMPLRRSTRHRNQVSRSTLEDEELYELEVEHVEDTTFNDPNKLKGVFWPGMDMFDSATPEMRRKRNQKKATSVVKQLEQMSEVVEATELVFSPSGSLRRARTISGFPDSDSDEPLKGEETPPKRRKSSRRQPLTERDPNANNHPRRKRDNLPFYGNNRPYYNDDQADDDLTYVSKQSKRKRKLQVHHDDDEEVTFDNPANMSYLTSSFQHPTHNNNHAEQHRPFNTSTTTMNPFRPVEPTYFSQGMSSFQPNYLTNPFSFEPPVLPQWDFLGQDFSTATQLANPLFMSGTGTFQNAHTIADDDDQRTISALASDN